MHSHPRQYASIHAHELNTQRVRRNLQCMGMVMGAFRVGVEVYVMAMFMIMLMAMTTVTISFAVQG